MNLPKDIYVYLNKVSDLDIQDIVSLSATCRSINRVIKSVPWDNTIVIHTRWQLHKVLKYYKFTNFEIDYEVDVKTLALFGINKEYGYLKVRSLINVTPANYIYLSRFGRLNLTLCKRINSRILPYLEKCEKIVFNTFKVIDCDIFQNLKNVKKLKFQSCDQLINLHTIGSLRVLKSLSIDHGNFDYLDLFECIQCNKSLVSLKINSFPFPSKRKIGYLKKFDCLKKLSLNSCMINDNVMKDLLQSYKCLEFLEITSEEIRDISYIAQLQRLKHLKISDCRYIDGLASLIEMKQLRELEISKCGLNNFETLEKLSQIVHLKLLKNVSHSEFINLIKANRLKSFEFDDSCFVMDLPNNLEHLTQYSSQFLLPDVLDKLKHLVSVKYIKCNDITDEDLTFFSHCREVDLSYCSGITSEGIKQLVGCKKLNVVGCENVCYEDIKDFINGSISI